MPQSHSNRLDSDPLLEFSSEPASSAPEPPPAAQLADNREVAPIAAPESTPKPAIDPWRERVETLEQSLDAANKEITALRSQVLTLVAAQRDINSRVDAWHQRIAAKPAKSVDAWHQWVAPQRRPMYRAASAVCGVIFGLVLAAYAWTYMTTDGEPIMTRAVAAPAIEQPAPLEPVAPPKTEIPAIEPVVLRVASPPARVISQEQPRAEVTTTNYVGTLSVDAAPGGDVFLNGKKAGHTPLRLQNLKAGSHLIWIERDGYRRWTKVVDVPADRVSRVFADLEQIASR